MRDALPLLHGAERVVLLEIAERGALASDRRVALREVQAWLARHGVDAEGQVQQGMLDVGDALLSSASDVSADPIVMGAYGHSRVREWIMGGATRHLLAHMTVPTLTSH